MRSCEQLNALAKHGKLQRASCNPLRSHQCLINVEPSNITECDVLLCKRIKWLFNFKSLHGDNCKTKTTESS